MFKNWFKVLIVLIVAGVLSIAALPQSHKEFAKEIPAVGLHLYDSKVSLGLDLAGGTHLEYRVVTAGIPAERLDAVIEGVIQVLEQRVNGLGVSEPIIYESRIGEERFIVVELAGIRDIEEAKRIVGKTIQLEFMEQKTALDPNESKEIESAASRMLAAVIPAPADFAVKYEEYKMSQQSQLAEGSDWLWLNDLPKESKIAELAAKTPAGQVIPQLVERDNNPYKVLSVVRVDAYEATADRTIVNPEKRAAQHVLIAFQGSQSAADSVTRTEEEARKRAEEVLAKAKAGEDFGGLAASYSDEPGAADRGGDLGEFGRGQMVPAFEEAAFGQLQPGLVDRIVRTDFGYHIIQVNQVIEGSTETRQEPRAKLTEAVFSTQPSGWQPTGLTGQHFRSAAVGTDPTTYRPLVNIYFTSASLASTELDWRLLILTVLGIVSGFGFVLAGLSLLSPAETAGARRRNIILTLLAGIVLAASIGGYQYLKSEKEAAAEAPVTTTAEAEPTIDTDTAGVQLFAEITKRNVGKPVAIFLDGQPIIDGDPSQPGLQEYAPVVQQEITGGQAVISGLASLEQAFDLAQNLNTGAIPAPIKLSGQYTIGAALGEEALSQSLQAGLIGLIAVAIFMLLYYRLPGLIADIALVIYTILSIYFVQELGIVLTLAGVAGFILSIGMAVDTNILIFERTKEELRLGKPVVAAVEDGFARAWPSIRDSHISTFMTCAILFWFGSSIIKGFALTLALGAVVNLITAFAVSRILLRAVAHTGLRRIPFLFGK